MTPRLDDWGQDADDDLEVHSDAVTMLEQLEGAEGLSPWEEEFLDSVREAVEAGRMTDRQADKVRQIHDERLTKGRAWRRPGRERR